MPTKTKKTQTSDDSKTSALLHRRIAQAIDRKNIEQKISSGKKLTIKLGRDPRIPTLHLGHSVPLRKLREFQLQGHEVVIVLGDFTALLGDPADDGKIRDILSPQQIEKNVTSIKKIFDKILDPKKTRFTYNSHWLGKLNFADVIKLASSFTVQQNIERDLFQRRLQSNKPIGLHEFMYPLMQAYDSVHLKPDLEVGGTDQTFNLLAGRTLMRNAKLEPQDILTTPMLEGTDGREMHSSWGNTIDLTDEPFDMYGKLMGVRDELIIKYMDLTTDMTQHEIDTVATQLKLGAISPIDAKKRLAREVVSLYHNADGSQAAEKQFEEVIQSKGIPEERSVFKLSGSGSINVIDLLVSSGLVVSRSEARRLIEQGGVDSVQVNKKTGEIINRSTVKEIASFISPGVGSAATTIIQVGKRKAVEVKP